MRPFTSDALPLRLMAAPLLAGVLFLGAPAALAQQPVAEQAPPIVDPTPAPVADADGAATPETALPITAETQQRLFGDDRTEAPQTGEEAAPEAEDESSPVIGTGDLVDLLIRLAAVAALVYGAVWGLRRWMRGRGGPASAGGRIRVLETIGLAQNRLLYVVDVQEKVLLLGATPQQLSLITEFTDDETTAAFREGSQGSRRNAAFPEHMRSLTARFGLVPSSGWQRLQRPDDSLATASPVDTPALPATEGRAAMLERLRERQAELGRLRATHSRDVAPEEGSA